MPSITGYEVVCEICHSAFQLSLSAFRNQYNDLGAEKMYE